MAGDITTGRLIHAPLIANGNDFSGNGRNFTAVGAPNYTGGIFGKGVTLNATNYLTIASPAYLSSLSALSIGFWTRSSTPRASAAAVSFGTAVATQVHVFYTYDFGYRIFSNNLTPVDRAGDGLPAANGSPVFNLWRVFNASSARLDFYQTSNSTWYSNSVVTNHSTAASLTALRLGMYHNGGQGYEDEIAEFNAYDRALADDDRDALMDSVLNPVSAFIPSRTSLGVGIGVGR